METEGTFPILKEWGALDEPESMENVPPLLGKLLSSLG